MHPLSRRNLSILQLENDQKDKHMEELERDLKAVSEVQNMENIQ